MRSRLFALLCAAMALSFVLAPSQALAFPQIAGTRFAASNGCGCHAGFVQTWGESMHAKALADPIFQRKLQEANRETNNALDPFCNACHGPIASMASEIASGKLSAAGKESVSCDFCHQVTGTTPKLGNASWTVAADGVKKAQLKDAVSPIHATAYSPFHEKPEFCGTCHDVNHPLNGMHLEATYSEWKGSPYAAEGVTCQDCHMTPGPGVTKPYAGKAAAGGPQRDHIYTMTWAGGNTALGAKDLAELNLKSAAKLEIATPGLESDVVEPGTKASVDVRVSNVGAGHYLPTGLTEVRQMWLEIRTLDEDGAEIVSTRHDFGTELKDAKGRSPVELWDAVGIAKDDRIPPRDSKTISHAFTMPERGPVRVEAVLLYRSASEELAKDSGVEMEETEMAKEEVKLFTSVDERKASVLAKAIVKPGGVSTGALLPLMGGLMVGFIVVAGTILVLRHGAKRGQKTEKSAEPETPSGY